MAIGDAYAEAADLELRLNATDDGTFDDLLLSASRHVELFTGRQFNREETATARKYRALDRERVAVDDFYETTDLSVSVSGTAWDAADYEPRPWDGVIGGLIDWPYSDLFAVNRYWPIYNFRRATIEVTARWGWSQVPAAIVQATLDVAEVMRLGAGVTSGSTYITSETIGDVTVGFSKPGGADLALSDVPRALVKAVPYRRKRFGVG